MTPRTTRAPVIAGSLILVLGLSLSACGEKDSESDNPVAKDSSSSATTTPSTEPTEAPSETVEPEGPLCADVWVAGSVLPGRYNGCLDEEQAKFVQAITYRCSSGQKLVTFRRNFYAVPGEVVNETTTPLARDPKFKKVMAICGA